jgi:hypothetical protein
MQLIVFAIDKTPQERHFPTQHGLLKLIVRQSIDLDQH